MCADDIVHLLDLCVQGDLNGNVFLLDVVAYTTASDFFVFTMKLLLCMG